MSSPRQAIPQRAIEVLGTLAHNRGFTRQDYREYLRWDSEFRGTADLAFKQLLRAKLIRRTEKRGEYYPTAKGWDLIDKAHRRES